jgi:hypothetical protein
MSGNKWAWFSSGKSKLRWAISVSAGFLLWGYISKIEKRFSLKEEIKYTCS